MVRAEQEHLTMKILAMALTLTLAALGQQHPLTNADVAYSVEHGYSTDAIIKWIKSAPSVDFRISPEYRPQLEKSGVSKEIINAMIRRVMNDDARSPVTNSEPKEAKPIPSKAPKPKLGDVPSARPEPASTPKAAQPVAPPIQSAPPGPPDTDGTVSAIATGSITTSAPATGATLPLPVNAESSPAPPSTGAATKANDALTVTSIPDGATVEWNRKVIGTTPLTYKVGEYAFNSRKLTVYSKRLRQPVILRVSKEGYIAREMTISQEMVSKGPNGRIYFYFYVIPTNNFQIDLDKISSVRAGMTNADVIKLKAAGFGDDLIIDRINNNPAAFKLEFDDLVELRKAGISDAVIQAMMHAK